MRAKDALGRHGEDLAARHLVTAGMQLVARNWRCREGEIDIVARDGPVLVFCEVKTRSSTAYGVPAEAVTFGKAQRLRVAALRWLAEHPHPGGDVRFDVVSVLRGRDQPWTVEHLRGVF